MTTKPTPTEESLSLCVYQLAATQSELDALRAENQRLTLTMEIAKEMRAWQKRYFKERTPSALTQSKQLERELDRRLADQPELLSDI